MWGVGCWLENRYCESGELTLQIAHSVDRICGWMSRRRDAVSIIRASHTDLEMDDTIDPSVQQHLNVSNFEVHTVPHTSLPFVPTS